MPRIRAIQQETSPYAAVDGRQATGVDFGAEVGVAVQQFGNEGQQQYQIVEQQRERANISDIQAKLAVARAEWTVEMQKRAQNSPLGDTTFAPTFAKDFSDYIAKTRENLVTTKAGARAFEVASAQMTAHFLETAGVYQAQSVGKKAVADYGTLVGANQKTIISDPTQFEALLKLTQAQLNDPNGPFAQMPAAEREKLREQTDAKLSEAAVQGLIMTLNAPELAKKKLIAGDYDKWLDGDRKDNLMKQAEVAINAKDSAAERERREAERAKKDAQDKVNDEFLKRITDPRNNGGALTDRDILANEVLSPAQKQHWIDYKRARAKEAAENGETRSNPRLRDDLLRDMMRDVDDPKKTFSFTPVRDAFIAGKISSRDVVFLEGRFNGLRDGSTNSFEKNANAMLSRAARTMAASPMLGLDPVKLMEAQGRLQEDLFRQVEEYRAAKKNPRDLLNPENKDSPFHKDNFGVYFGSPRQNLSEAADKARAGATELPIGTIQNFAQGSFKYKGGPVNQQSSWEPVKSKPIGGK